MIERCFIIVMMTLESCGRASVAPGDELVVPRGCSAMSRRTLLSIERAFASLGYELFVAAIKLKKEETDAHGRRLHNKVEHFDIT